MGEAEPNKGGRTLKIRLAFLTLLFCTPPKPIASESFRSDIIVSPQAAWVGQRFNDFYNTFQWNIEEPWPRRNEVRGIWDVIVYADHGYGTPKLVSTIQTISIWIRDHESLANRRKILSVPMTASLDAKYAGCDAAGQTAAYLVTISGGKPDIENWQQVRKTIRMLCEEEVSK